MNIRLTPEEVEAHIKSVQIQEERRKVARRRQEDFKVFVSYSHEDKAICQRLTALFDELEVKNYVVDEKTLEWGNSISQFARDEITNCTHFLLILSESSSRSQWCSLEFGIAFGLKKDILLFLANDSVPVPGHASDCLATSDINVVAGYFSRELIDAEAVKQLIVEIIGDQEAVLEEFEPTDERESGECWDSPDKEAIEGGEPEGALFEYVGGARVPDPWRLVRIEVHEPFAPEAIVLYYHSARSSNQKRCTLSFRPELGGVVVEPRKDGTYAIGVRETTGDGDERLVSRSPSTMDKLYGRDVEGWEVSRSFWEQTVATLRSMLPD